MCFGIFTCMMVPKATEEDTEFPDAGVSGKCGAPDVVAGNRIHVLCYIQLLLMLSHLSSNLLCF